LFTVAGINTPVGFANVSLASLPASDPEITFTVPVEVFTLTTEPFTTDSWTSSLGFATDCVDDTAGPITETTSPV
jgi:hypothetical protein